MEREELESFDVLYATHARGLHAYFLGRTGDTVVADDLLQETFVRVWRHLDTIVRVPEARRRYWLYRTAHNILVDAYRRRHVRRGEVLATDAGECAIEARDRVSASRDALRTQVEERMDLEEAISQLPERLRVILAMSLAGGMSSRDIGEALGCPAGTVRYWLSEARRRLASALGVAEPMQTECVKRRET